MKKIYYFYSLLLVALLCSGSMWGEDLTLTVMNDDYFNQYVPVDGYGLDASQHNQFLLLGSELSSMNGCDIKGLTFYLDKTGHAWYNTSNIPNVTFRLAEVSNTSLSSQVTVDESFTQVYSGSISFSFAEKEWNITFDEPYSYNGGNLLIDVQTTAGSYIKKNGSTYMRFYTSNVSGRAMRGSSSHSYCPKMTFTYEPAPAGGCAKPKNLTKSDDTPEGATFTWEQNADETTYQWACVASGSEVTEWTTLDENVRTKTVTGLTAGTAYDFHVRSYCGAGEGEQSASAKSTFTPTCPAPTAPVVSGISATGATLSWTAAADITKYQYIVVERDAAEVWTSPTLVESAITASLTALTAGTKYDVYVRSYFNETSVSTSVKAQFATPCVAMSAISDFNGTFESDIAGSGLMPNCWEAAASYTYENYYYGNTTYPCVKETYSSKTGDKCLAFHGGTNTTKTIALLPVFTEALNTLTISFYYKNSGTSSYYGNFTIGYYKNGVFTAYEGGAIPKASSYADTPFEFAIPNIAEAEGARLAIQYAGGSYNYEAFIDDITITLTPSCAKPTGVTTSNIVYDGATIDWKENGSAEEWKVQYSTDNTNWETKNVTTHPYELRGLTTGTPYYVQVIAVCGPTDESPAVAAASTFTPAYKAPTDLAVSSTTTTTATFSWTVNSGETAWTVQYKKSGDADWTTVENVSTNPYTLTGLTSGSSYQVKVAAGTLYTAAVDFNTECEAKAIPFSADFNDAEANKLPSCWSAAGNTTAVYVAASSSYLTLSSKALYFTGGSGTQAIVILPEINADLNTLQIAFSHVEESTTKSGQIKFGYYKDATFTELKTCEYSSSSSVWKDEAAFPITGVPAEAKLAFSYTPIQSAYTAALDNISVTEYVAPSCAAPTALTVTDITTNSASISWTSVAAAFALEYKKTSDADWTAATAPIASPFVLANLMPNETEYTVRVKAICGENNESEWAELTAPFKTQCAVKTVTEETAWTEDFEAQTADQAPACWYLPTPNDSYYYAKVITSDAKESTRCLDIKTYGTSSEIIVLPEFNEPVEHLNISFDYKNVNTGSRYGYLEVGYYSGSTFTRVGEALSKVENYTASGVIEMPKTDVPAGARIAFRLVGVYSSYYSHVYIDNLSVSRKPACAVPTNLAAVATSTGAILTWAAGDEETQWNVRYSVKDADTWTVLDNKTSGFAITGLEVGTAYEVQVQAYCDENHQSAWTASANFTPVCAAPAALAVTARTKNSATFTWNSSENAWVLQYSADGENWESENVAVNPFTLEGLTAGQTYQAKIQTSCGSDFSNVVEFTTWCDSKLSLPVAINGFSEIPACWEVYPAGAVQLANSKLCFVGEGEKFIYLPQSDINMNLLSITMTVSGSLELGYISEPNGAFTQIVANVESGTEYDLATLDPQSAQYFAIRYNGTTNLSQASISAVSIRKTPTCAKPTALTATPAVGSATIDWMSDATAWNIQYKLASAADWTDAEVTAKPFEITGLAQGVIYNVRAQANCGDELSDWSDVISFTTNCSSIDALPYYADFSVALSSCWVVFAQDESYYKPYANTAMNQLVMNGGKEGASNNVVVMPPFSADLLKAVISFEYSCSTGANYAQLEVGYVTDKADAATFIALETLAQSGSWGEARVAAAAVPANAYIAFRYAGANSHGDLAIRKLRVINQLVLAHNENNTSLLLTNEGKTLDVQIGRTFVCADYYNTICLPFSLSAEELAASPIATNDLWAFKYARVENNELLIRIIEADHINAGEPYLIAWPQGDPIENPLFKNVTISATAGKTMGEENLKFVGILKPETFAAHDDTKLFLYEHNTLYWWNGDAESNLNSFRAFFTVEDGAGASTIKNMPARIIKHDQTVTDCETINAENGNTVKIVENNQVVIIRNGVKYSIQGQKIQ